MKNILLATALTIGLTSPASAALSGFFDTAEQVQTIIESMQVADALHQLPFDTIDRVGTRDDGVIEWRVQNPDCSVIVDLKPIRPVAVGKTTYEIIDVSACGERNPKTVK